ncbi:hypothetical protein PMIN06_003710 [Paraphaeosphaeria minitans]
MHHHHDTEEEQFFFEIEKTRSVAGLMEAIVEQYRAFTPGFESFDAWVKSCQLKDFDGKKMKELFDVFATPLHIDLVDEIATLRALDKYDSDVICLAYKRFDKSAMNTDKYRIGPLVFGTADRAFEGGIHNK